MTSQLQGGEEQVGGEEGGSLVLRLNFLRYTVLKKIGSGHFQLRYGSR